MERRGWWKRRKGMEEQERKSEREGKVGVLERGRRNEGFGMRRDFKGRGIMSVKGKNKEKQN
jgi:hypothetical protein